MKRNLRQKLYSVFLLSSILIVGCEEEAPEIHTQDVYIMVHHEIYEESEYASQWLYIRELVHLADEYGHKLTLSFMPEWGEFILADEDVFNEMRSWEENGHEIAGHHHGPTHAAWDGYTDLHAKKRDPRYEGDINAAMDILDQLPAGGEVMSMSMSDAEIDWPEGIYIMSKGAPDDKVDSVSIAPVEAVYNGVDVTEYGKAGYLTGKPAVDVDLETILVEIDSSVGGEVIGLALSDENFSTEGVFEGIEFLFEELQSRGIQTRTLTDIHIN